MRKIIRSCVAASAMLAAPLAAQAADLRVKAPVYKAPIVPVWSWTGFYVGGNVGYGWGNGNLSVVPGPLWDGPFGFPNNAAFFVANGAPNLKLRGALGGAQVGYNVQHGNSVFGVEADFSFANIAGGRTTGFLATPPGLANRRFSESDRLAWLATARARVGFAAQNLLFYATGGLAVGRHEFSQSIISILNANNNVGSVSATKVGWTVGGGVEAQLAGNWTAKAEYLYVDLGTVSAFSDSNTSPGFGATIDTSNRLTANIVRAGLNYKFDWGPVVAKY